MCLSNSFVYWFEFYNTGIINHTNNLQVAFLKRKELNYNSDKLDGIDMNDGWRK